MVDRRLRAWSRPAAGYTLVALVIGMAVMTILLAAVGPVIATVMRRDREDELIFRGRQYARGVALFQRRFGRYPNTLKEMYENRPRTLRQLWKDPMCRCDNWHVLILGSPDAVPAKPSQTGLQAQPTPVPTPTPGAFGTPNAPSGPIVGVRSNVHQEALREWRGHKYYDEWAFIAGDADKDVTSTNPFYTGVPGPLMPTQPPSN